MSTIHVDVDKIILNLDNGDMFAAKVTIGPDSRSRHFLKVEQKSHNGNMQTIIDRDGSTLLCKTLIDVLSEGDDVVGQQLYKKLHNKYGKGTTAIDDIVKVFNNPHNYQIGSHAGLLAIHNILKKNNLI